jgi:hypothetical protein
VFGDAADGAMRLNEAGQMIQSIWDKIPAFYGESLNHIRQHSADNPARWSYDREDLAATRPEPEEVWLI